MTTDNSVAIVGSGIVGSALALALAQSGIRVILIEKQPIGNFDAGDDYRLRVSAISIASEYLLRNLSVWQQLQDKRLTPYTQMHVWDAVGSGEIHFDSAEMQLSCLGHIIENELIQSELLSAASCFDNFSLLNPANVTGLQLGKRRVKINLDNGEQYHAALVVGADGAQSSIRALAEIPVQSWDYKQQGIVAVVAAELSHQNTAWQRFMPGGPLAVLPLADKRCSIVWSRPDSEAKRLLALSDTAFCSELTAASENIFGEFTLCSQRAGFPLRYQHSKRYVQPRLALVGDAAHIVHPLAGQGVNLGLMDVACLAELIIDSHTKERDVGAYKLLRRYERARRFENQAMAWAFDGLNMLFSNDRQPQVWLRNAGLGIANQLAVLKQFFMQRATGMQHALQSYRSSNNVNGSLLLPPEYYEVGSS